MRKTERNIEDRTILDEFAEQFCDIVNKHCKYIVCSGFVAIAHGRTRGTEDIDMIVEKLNKEQFINLHKDLIKGGLYAFNLILQTLYTWIIYLMETASDMLRRTRISFLRRWRLNLQKMN